MSIKEIKLNLWVKIKTVGITNDAAVERTLFS